ncbi:dihydrofolate reductase family protein [Cyclobacterium plantarum]|uniref:Dihydrofolate reductase n=1 Tax=Cyclobacterium plantarum TaxID=2716263 RepID=A0ABX0H389_9BACT|nr:dihydrofolate reductase family protein [Cyclobacterium plantarum]NHE56279.1 dihydrofolate reductase [Cyclobacterium plantarum]
MRKIIYAQMVSLDGYIEGPNGSLSWSAPGVELHKHFNDLYLSGEIDTSIYGRRLYDNMASYWPSVKEDGSASDVEKEFAGIWKQVPKLVYSKTLKTTSWNSKLVRELIPEEIQQLKEQEGNKIEIGGGNLAEAFIRLGLVDEFWMYVHPVVLGGGKPYFPAGLEMPLFFIDTLEFPCKVLRLRYKFLKK